MTDVPVLDSFQFFGPSPVPASVSYDITWTATDDGHRFNADGAPPTSRRAFSGLFYDAVATGSFSGRESGFRFSSDPGVTSEGAFAEIGHERNGAFLH